MRLELLDLVDFVVSNAVCNAVSYQLGCGFSLLVMLTELFLRENAEVCKCLVRRWLHFPLAESRFKFTRRLERCEGKGKL